jgi:hypothetical protein
MHETFTSTAIVRTFALLAILMIVAAGYSTSALAAQVPTLTNDVGQPGGGAEAQLAVGIALLTFGLLGVLAGIAARRTASGRRR